MDFTVIQVFAAGADAVARAYASPELYEHLVGLPKLGTPEVLDHRVDGDIVRLQVRYRFVGDLSPAVTAVVDPRRLSWVEHSTHDLAARTRALPAGARPLRRPAAVVGIVHDRRPHQRRQRAHGDGPPEGARPWSWEVRSSGPSCRGCASTWPRRSPSSTASWPLTVASA